jgi:hypothetical protein
MNVVDNLPNRVLRYSKESCDLALSVTGRNEPSNLSHRLVVELRVPVPFSVRLSPLVVSVAHIVCMAAEK